MEEVWIHYSFQILLRVFSDFTLSILIELRSPQRRANQLGGHPFQKYFLNDILLDKRHSLQGQKEKDEIKMISKTKHTVGVFLGGHGETERSELIEVEMWSNTKKLHKKKTCCRVHITSVWGDTLLCSTMNQSTPYGPLYIHVDKVVSGD